MIKEVEVIFEGTCFGGSSAQRYNMREYIDTYHLHTLDVAQTVFALTNTVPSAFFHFFESIGLTQEDVEYLYKLGGEYAIATVSASNMSTLGSFRLIAHAGTLHVRGSSILNLYDGHTFIVRLDTQTYVNGESELIGYYVPREPYSESFRLKLSAENITDLRLIGYPEQEKQVVQELLNKDYVHLTGVGENYFNTCCKSSYLYGLNLWGMLEEELTARELYTKASWLYFSIDINTGDTVVYI